MRVKTCTNVDHQPEDYMYLIVEVAGLRLDKEELKYTDFSMFFLNCGPF